MATLTLTRPLRITTKIKPFHTDIIRIKQIVEITSGTDIPIQL
jgi:hypothetical protein